MSKIISISNQLDWKFTVFYIKTLQVFGFIYLVFADKSSLFIFSFLILYSFNSIYPSLLFCKWYKGKQKQIKNGNCSLISSDIDFSLLATRWVLNGRKTLPVLFHPNSMCYCLVLTLPFDWNLIFFFLSYLNIKSVLTCQRDVI